MVIVQSMWWTLEKSVQLSLLNSNKFCKEAIRIVGQKKQIL